MAFFIFLSFFIASLLFFAQKTTAHCPLCVAATGSFVATSRIMGIDDAITGTFVGAFIISTALWTDRMLSKRKIRLPLQPYALSLLFIALTFAGFFIFGFVSGGFATIMGIDRFIFGILAGSMIILFSYEAHNLLRKSNNGKNHLPFQGIVLPMLVLVLFDVLMYAAGVFG